MREQVLSDEVKRKQYDTYGSAGPSTSGAGQQYWRPGTTVDPEELFRKIFGEFAGAQGFGDFSSIFDQPLEVSPSSRMPASGRAFFSLLALKSRFPSSDESEIRRYYKNLE